MKRITFITGHYGSGKSEFAVNLAVVKQISNVVDLDIVNPYFRSRELLEVLKENNIKLVSSSVENSLGSDLPYIAKEAYILPNTNESIIYDLGGDPVGARVLRQFSDIVKRDEIDLLLCINIYRPETSNAKLIIKMINEIEGSGGYKITGLVNNSNFLKETTYEDIIAAEDIINEVSDKTNLKVIYTGVYEKLIPIIGKLSGEVIPLKLYLRNDWL